MKMLGARIAKLRPECKVLVLSNPFSKESGYLRLKIWNEEDPRCFALLLPDLRVLGPSAKAVEAFQRRKLLAAVAEDFPSGDPLIVTRDNVVEVLQSQPQALGF